MLKQRTYDMYCADDVEFNLDLIKGKENILKALDKSTPKRVKRFNSNGTKWDISRKWHYSTYDFCIDGGNIHITDITASIFDFLNFLEQIAYFDDKKMLASIDDEGCVFAITSIPLGDNLIRFTVFDYGVEYKQKILSDIIIDKTIFIKQFRNIFIKISKYMKAHPDEIYPREEVCIKNSIETLGQYLNNPEEFKNNYIPTSHIRAFDIAFKKPDSDWEFTLCLEDEEKANPEHWETLKRNGEILDYDYRENYPKRKYWVDYKNGKIIHLTNDEVRKNLETSMQDRLEDNWVYSPLSKKWYSTNEIMPEPECVLGVIYQCLSYKITVDTESYPHSEEEQLENYAKSKYNYKGELVDDERLDSMKCWLDIKYDTHSTVCRIEFDYRNNKKIHEALEKIKTSDYVRFDLGGHTQEKMHIWRKKWNNPNNKGDDYFAIACYSDSDERDDNGQLYHELVEAKFIDCFINALDEIENKLQVVEHCLNVAKDLDLDRKFKYGKHYDDKFEQVDNFIGDYACVYKSSIY